MQVNHSKVYSGQNIPLEKIGKNLSFLMKKYGVDAQKLSDQTGVGIATIKNLRRGSGNPTISTLSSIADFFHITVGALTDNDTLQSSLLPRKSIVTIPLIKYSDIDDFVLNIFTHVTEYTIEVDDPSDDSLFAFEVTSNAFSPEIDRSSICIVSLNEKCNDGDIVLVKTKDYPIFLRRTFFGDQCMFFCNISLEADITPVQYTNYNIVGVLQRIIKRLK